MPTYLSQSAKDLISRLLQKDPRNRMNLREVSQHPFLKSDASITESQVSIRNVYVFSKKKKSVLT